MLYQINTRVLLSERGAALGRPATLDDIDDALLDELASDGFSWVWLLGVWQTGPEARRISRTNPGLCGELARSLPDLREQDITGSPFAVVAWTVHEDFGGDAALARLRERLARRHIQLLLDFVPNHVAPDHPWLETHPEYFIHGSEDDLAREPQSYRRIETRRERLILAHGRDPHFAGWADTLQLDYRQPGVKEAQIRELVRVAERCDGVRCDMAMLLQPQIFERTWGSRAPLAGGPSALDRPFWPDAIGAVRAQRADFVFVAEVYWGMEAELQQVGFDYTYDKGLYDRLRDGHCAPVREHLRADLGFQRRCVRFIENHDEPRAASVFPRPMHEAAAVIAFMAPGMRLFHEGQLDGRRTHVSMHVGRRPPEPPNPELRTFYRRLLRCSRRPEVRGGEWRLWTCREASPGNSSHEQLFVATWVEARAAGGGARPLLIAVNYGDRAAQGYAQLELPALARGHIALRDLLGDTEDVRRSDDASIAGLYLDLPAWGRHVFELEAVS